MAERRPTDGRKKMVKLKMKCYISYKFNIFVYQIKPEKQKRRDIHTSLFKSWDSNTQRNTALATQTELEENPLIIFMSVGFILRSCNRL